ncbi:MAG: primosomal protein N' [Bacteroidota bacterium]
MYKIAEVILPLPVKSNFYYSLSEEQAEVASLGQRVLVHFGKRKIYTGLIRQILSTSDEEEYSKLKPIDEILDTTPILFAPQLAMFEWISYYYSCTEGDVFKASLPAGLKPEGSLRIEMSPGLDWEKMDLPNQEYLLLEQLSVQPVLNFQDVGALWNVTNPYPRLKNMESRGFIILYEEAEQRYKPKFKTYLRLHPDFTSEEKLKEAFESFSARQVSQENLFTKIVSAFYQEKAVPKSETLKELSLGPHVVKSLVKAGFIQEEKVQVDRLAFYGYEPKKRDIVLTERQQHVLTKINALKEGQEAPTILLHGVTGSGKTHIYIELIKDALNEGKQVLYLLPEITLTKQIIDRVKSELGDTVGVYHSKFNDNERVEIWQKVQKREQDVVIGVRSSIFLPFSDLGLIIVDEEHDSSYKQQDPAPRYNARDVAVYYGKQEKVPVILGSATPSFESYHNAIQGKYYLTELPTRAVAREMPELEVVDMRIQRKKKLNKGILSLPLYNSIAQALQRKEQVILFQNRRGYSPYLICENCGHVPQCINCDISLTYHKEKNHMRCHYCGYTNFTVDKCDNCHHYALKRAGTGTEKIVEEVAYHFPDFQVERMDLDTTRTKFGYQQIIQRFENQQIQVLVGTQMVSKGLDIENVTLVGVINADNLLSFPDFRAHEHAYQLMKQVSGRAGRSHKKGKVIIQSMMPENAVLQALDKPFKHFYYPELHHRQELSYPPYKRLIRIEIRHKDRRYLETESVRFQKLLFPHFSNQLLGPDYALIPRLRNMYRMQFLLKLSKNFSVKKVREILYETIDKYYQRAPKKTMRIMIDVDPM